MEEERCCKLPECGKPLVKKPDETRQNYRNREYCDKRCSGIHDNRKRKRMKKKRG